jgi:anionic cell wall polymer biosynthesis LytR-Cps2A-Psr (LCP) family protein
MMLLLVNPKTKKTTMISIPRDAMVSIPGYESTFPQKINAAYAYGSNGNCH